MTASSVTIDLLAYNFNLETPDLFSKLTNSNQLVGQSFMHELAREGDVLSAEVILAAGGNIDLPDDEGRRPLHEAAYSGRLEMVKFLIKSGAQVDAPIHPFGYTALYYAVQQGHQDIVRYLLKQGARLNCHDRLTGQGLLHIAAARDDMMMTGILISSGIDVFHEDKKGQTARDHAARNNHKPLENVLVKVMEHHAFYGA